MKLKKKHGTSQKYVGIGGTHSRNTEYWGRTFNEATEWKLSTHLFQKIS